MMRPYLLFLLAAVPAAATQISILNPSFEDGILPLDFGYAVASQVVPGSPHVGGTLPNWTPINPVQGNYIGAYNPSSNSSPNWSFTWETGNNVAYAQSIGNGSTSAGVSQILTAVLEANTTYTLSVDVGRRQFTFPTWNYSVELWAGSTQLGSGFSFPGMTGNSVNTQLLTVAIGSSHVALNQPLEIRLLTNGYATEAFFDNVQLDGSTVPEPGTWAVVLSGLAVLALRRRR